MLMTGWRASPATSVRSRVPHSSTTAASKRPSTVAGHLDGFRALERLQVGGRRVVVDDPDRLAERTQRVGQRQLRADGVAVRPDVRGQHEALAVQQRGRDACKRIRASSLFFRIDRCLVVVATAGFPALALDVVEDPCDAVLPLGGIVVQESDLRHLPKLHSLPDCASQIRPRAAQGRERPPGDRCRSAGCSRRGRAGGPLSF